MKIYWMKSSEAFPDSSWPKTRLEAFDEDWSGESIGCVYLSEGGMKSGQSVWSVYARFTGPAFGGATNGYAATRGEAGHQLVDCYARMLKLYGRQPNLAWGTDESSGS